ncbi:hypothetical protein ISS37_00890 [candidate division KSB1 bacterium]|nr:hypothetical protein [candidate division KSB1 bacterium]
MVKAFRINLNKIDHTALRAIRWRRRRDKIIFGAIIGLMVIMAGFQIRIYGQLNRIIQEKKEKLAEINRKIDELKQTTRDVSKQDVLALAELENKRILWTKKLKALARELPPDMALTGLEYRHKNLIIKGIAPIKKGEKEFDKVKQLIDRLRSNPDFFRDFEDIKFDQVQRIKVGDQRILSLSIICYVRKSGQTRSRSPQAVSGKT